MRDKVRVVVNEERPIHTFHQKDDGVVKGKLVRTELRERVIFSGSKNAFEIWRQVHAVPVDAKITHFRSDVQLHKFVEPKQQQCFAQDSTFYGR